MPFTAAPSLPASDFSAIALTAVQPVARMADRPTISLITITRDEERLIGQCLKSAWFCDELIVVDSCSTDRTVQIAKSLGATVVEHEFTNYVMQKQMALDRATSDWVLLMDA